MAQAALHRNPGVRSYSDDGAHGSPIHLQADLPFTGTRLLNPHFVFPLRTEDPVPRSEDGGIALRRRPASANLLLDPQTSVPRKGTQRVPTALPDFIFNPSSNTPGVDITPPHSPTTRLPVTPSRGGGHRRGGSELIGGDARVAGSIRSTSAMEDSKMASNVKLEPPAGRRGHAHRRSGAISCHDLSSLRHLTDGYAPFGSGSAPASPMSGNVMPNATPIHARSITDFAETPGGDIDGQQLDRSPIRRFQTRGIRFAETVDYIPRPLSTISSETESSMSTVRGHSVSGSISSVISGGAASPPFAKIHRLSLTTTLEESSRLTPSPVAASTAEAKVAAEFRSSTSNLLFPARPTSVRGTTLPQAVTENGSLPLPSTPPKKGHPFDLDRRQSDPLLGRRAAASPSADLIGQGSSDLASSSQVTLQSVQSLPEGLVAHTQLKSVEKQSKIRSWASALVSRKPKQSDEKKQDIRPKSMPVGLDPELWNSGRPKPANAHLVEFDGSFDLASTVTVKSEPLQVGLTSDFSNVLSKPRSLSTPACDAASPVIDLDDAMYPSASPSLWPQLQVCQGRRISATRRTMHSSGFTGGFSGPGMHYHRRAESAPASPSLGHPQSNLQGFSPYSAFDDVFEEEDEEIISRSGLMSKLAARGERNLEEGNLRGLGVHIADSSDVSNLAITHRTASGSEIGQGILNREKAVDTQNPLEPSITDFDTSTQPLVKRISAVKRSNDVTPAGFNLEAGDATSAKSADSAVALAVTPGGPRTFSVLPNLNRPTVPPSYMTPATSTASAFSSPELNSPRGSFETHRVGTAASSFTDDGTISSLTVGEPGPALPLAMEDVPSLTSSRSTKTSSLPSNFHSVSSRIAEKPELPHPMPKRLEENRRKRASIASLSKLVSGSFGEKGRLSIAERPQNLGIEQHAVGKEKKGNALSRMMKFWKLRK